MHLIVTIFRIDSVQDKNNMSNFFYGSKNNYGNAIYPSEFTGDRNDDDLKFLSIYLKTLKDIENVRRIEKRNWKQKI